MFRFCSCLGVVAFIIFIYKYSMAQLFRYILDLRLELCRHYAMPLQSITLFIRDINLILSVWKDLESNNASLPGLLPGWNQNLPIHGFYSTCEGHTYQKWCDFVYRNLFQTMVKSEFCMFDKAFFLMGKYYCSVKCCSNLSRVKRANRLTDRHN